MVSLLDSFMLLQNCYASKSRTGWLASFEFSREERKKNGMMGWRFHTWAVDAPPRLAVIPLIIRATMSPRHHFITSSLPPSHVDVGSCSR